ncbi:MAG: phage terminase large subunit, partial [Kiritimatiellae bacterium]|nr:phage terminase large subunit [Kiritimatiellia bacterium]
MPRKHPCSVARTPSSLPVWRMGSWRKRVIPSSFSCRARAPCLRMMDYRALCAGAVDALGLRPWCTFRLSPLQIDFRTGQRILFRGADDPGKSKSIALARGYFGYLWFEEFSEFDGMGDIVTIRASAVRGKSDQRPITFCSYNPPASAHSWVNREALAPRPARRVHHSTYLELPREWIGEAFIADAEALRSSNERAYRHMYLGEVTGTGGQVFDNLRIRPIGDGELDALSAFYNGLDFGFASDPDALTRWAWSPGRRTLYALREFYGSHTLVDALAGKVRDIAGRELVWCDSADGRMIAELRRRGVNAVGASKGAGSVRAGIWWLQQLAAIVIDPERTPNLAREFSGSEY